MLVREAKDGDLDGLMRLYAQLHGVAGSAPGPAVTALWERVLADAGHHIVVAEEDGELVSSCVCVVIPCLTRDRRPFALIENVVTDSAHRNRGLATACLDFAKELAVRENCYKLMLMTGSKLESTFRFYERAGYNRRDKTAFVQWLDP